jgi:hypothetical protein
LGASTTIFCRILSTDVIFSVSYVLLITLVIHTYTLTYTDDIQDVYAFWVAYVFIGCYGLEMVLKLLGLGLREYFSSPWNCFDCLVTMCGLVRNGETVPNFGLLRRYLTLLQRQSGITPDFCPKVPKPASS